MFAAILEENSNSLKVKEVPIPQISDDEVLVKVKACGVCHTDLHYIDHGIRTFKSAPIILGHESTGIICKMGKDVANVNVGDRVIIPAVLTCGSCKYCKISRENLCLKMEMLGNHIDGAYAEYVKVKPKYYQKKLVLKKVH